MPIKQDHTLQETLVSFIIPVYNVPTDMLRECIESILQLTLRQNEREIIVVDDGSDSAVIKELDDYSNHIIYIRQKNQGLSAARNRGILLATGRYIQFVDADDKLVSNLYEHCLDIIRMQKPDITAFNFTDSLPAPIQYTDMPIISGADYLRRYNIKGSVCCYLFKKATLGDLRFTYGTFHEDEEFTPLLLLRAETVCVTNAKAYFYRKRHNSITTNKNMRVILKRLNDSKEIIYGLYSKFDKIPLTERLALQRRVAQLTMDYIYNIIVTTRNRHYLNRRLNELKSKGLFPLPDQNYTKKYKWFRKMTNSDLGITILMRTLPLMKKER